jgi:hypothetical protein
MSSRTHCHDKFLDTLQKREEDPHHAGWRLADLKVLQTIACRRGPRGLEQTMPGEPLIAPAVERNESAIVQSAFLAC